ncbi:MAG: HAD-IIA family hydrolase [Opitutaceae bacterium]|nr:HAD-IIA family hydrolase [Opitutaceae bacterium]
MAATAHAYLLDMDGVLYRGRRAVPGAAGFIRRLHVRGIPYRCITNHSCFTPEDLAAKLEGLGIPVPAANIMTAGQVTAAWLQGQGARGVFALGEPAFHRALAEVGIDGDSAKPSHVVVSLDRGMDYERMAQAARFILAGVPFVATNPDPSYPTEKGAAPECGFFLAGFERMTRRKPLVIGKPGPHLFRLGAAALGLPRSRLTMVGDRLDTDILGAKRAGLRTVLVLSGHTTAAMLKTARLHPDHIVTSVAHLERGQSAIC